MGEFTHVEFEITTPYTVKISATNYKPSTFEITAAELVDSVKSNKPIEHTVILESTEPPPPINSNRSDNNGVLKDNQNSNRTHVDNWYDPIVDVVGFLRTYWW